MPVLTSMVKPARLETDTTTTLINKRPISTFLPCGLKSSSPHGRQTIERYVHLSSSHSDPGNLGWRLMHRGLVFCLSLYALAALVTNNQLGSIKPQARFDRYHLRSVNYFPITSGLCPSTLTDP